MEELKTTTKIVKAVLEHDEMARNSDSFLYLKVLEHISARNGINLGFVTVKQLFSNLDYYGFPGFETVRRTRQKIQRECPELAANRDVINGRNARQAVFRSFAKGEYDA